MSVRKIKGGIYLVIDPSMEAKSLFQKLEKVLHEKIAAVQIWDHWNEHADKESIISRIVTVCHSNETPVLMNNDWQMLREFDLDGVHFDEAPKDFENIKKSLNQYFITGVTCSNDLSVVEWAEAQNLDYISFCSIFPSATSNSCDLVSFDTIRKARQITSLPIFLAGGINPDNMGKLKELDFDGVAVISGIMSQEDPALATKKYSDQLKK